LEIEIHMSKKECKCSMRIKLVGDGCEICNPERAEELSEPVSAPISAAPELLEVLELLVDTYEDGGWPSATIVIAKAAIAKAKGESIR